MIRPESITAPVRNGSIEQPFNTGPGAWSCGGCGALLVTIRGMSTTTVHHKPECSFFSEMRAGWEASFKDVSRSRAQAAEKSGSGVIAAHGPGHQNAHRGGLGAQGEPATGIPPESNTPPVRTGGGAVNARWQEWGDRHDRLRFALWFLTRPLFPAWRFLRDVRRDDGWPDVPDTDWPVKP